MTDRFIVQKAGDRFYVVDILSSHCPNEIVGTFTSIISANNEADYRNKRLNKISIEEANIKLEGVTL